MFTYTELIQKVEEALHYKFITVDNIVGILRNEDSKIVLWYYDSDIMKEIFNDDYSYDYNDKKDVLKLKADYYKDKDNLEYIFVKKLLSELKKDI